MPKILQINSCCNIFSTGKIASEIGEMAISHGWESYIAYARGYKESKNIPIKVKGTLRIWLHALCSRIFDNSGFSIFSKRPTLKLIDKIKQINPDIIHLHIVHGYYLHLPTLFKFLSECGKPIIWTNHSCWDFTGHCGFYTKINCNKWQSGCHNCPQLGSYPKSYLYDNTKRNWELKRELFNSVKNLTLVPVSHWLAREIDKSFLKSKNIYPIYNGVDLNIFKPLDYDCKAKFGWDNKIVLIALASNWEPRKNLNDYLRLSKVLTSDYKLILVGLTKKQSKHLPENIESIPVTTSLNQLVELYNAADIVLNLSYEETFGLTTVEGMACGTPGIVYNSTASPELIDENTGFVVEVGDIENVWKKIQMIKLKGKRYYTKFCRKRVAEKFDKDKLYKKYIELYSNFVCKN